MVIEMKLSISHFQARFIHLAIKLNSQAIGQLLSTESQTTTPHNFTLNRCPPAFSLSRSQTLRRTSFFTKNLKLFGVFYSPISHQKDSTTPNTKNKKKKNSTRFAHSWFLLFFFLLLFLLENIFFPFPKNRQKVFTTRTN